RTHDLAPIALWPRADHPRLPVTGRGGQTDHDGLAGLAGGEDDSRPPKHREVAAHGPFARSRAAQRLDGLLEVKVRGDPVLPRPDLVGDRGQEESLRLVEVDDARSQTAYLSGALAVVDVGLAALV